MSNKLSNFYTLVSLSLVLIIDALIMGIVFPLMGALFINPQYAIVPHAMSLILRDTLYSITMGIFFLCTIIGAPLLGDLSDAIGRRKVLLMTLFTGAMSCLVCAAAISLKLVWLLIFARAVAGLASGNESLAQAAMIDISTPENKARNIGLLTLASCLGFAIGPLIGGVFSDNTIFKFLTYATPFLIASVLALINAVALLFTFQETFNPPGRKKIRLMKGFTLLIDGFKHEKLNHWMVLLFIGQLAWGIYFQSISLILAQVHHYSTGQVGLFMAFLAVLFALGLGVVVPPALKRYKMLQLLLFGFLISAIAAVFNFIFIHSVLVNWLDLIPFILGQVFIYTITMTFISNSVGSDAQGWAMGVGAAVGSFAWGIAALSIGIMVSLNVRLPFIVTSLLFVVCYFLANYHYRDGRTST
jgi:MFS transporter, DHA1 family, tetracycline resistance protein